MKRKTLNFVRSFEIERKSFWDISNIEGGGGERFFPSPLRRRDGYGTVGSSTLPVGTSVSSPSLLPGALSNCNLVFMNSLYVAPLLRSFPLPLLPSASLTILSRVALRGGHGGLRKSLHGSLPATTVKKHESLPLSVLKLLKIRENSYLFSRRSGRRKRKFRFISFGWRIAFFRADFTWNSRVK